LFDGPEARHRAFRVAKDLYDLRSTIAHGGALTADAHRIGDEKLTLDGAAIRVSDVLRHVVRHFLGAAAPTVFTKSHFWERGYFGLPLL
jgi:hypothetical protein